MAAGNKSYYDVLGVPENASRDEIRNAYRRRARRWHPDKHASEPPEKQKEASEMFILVKEAYDVLHDPVRRYGYDCSLHPVSFDPQPVPNAPPSSAPHARRGNSRGGPPPGTRRSPPRPPEPPEEIHLASDTILGVLGFMFVVSLSLIFCATVLGTPILSAVAGKSGKNPPVVYGMGNMPKASVYDYGVSPKHQDVCFTPRHASFGLSPLEGGTEHFEFQVMGIDYLTDCTLVHWRYRARSVDQEKMLLPVNAFTVRAWRDPGNVTYYNVESMTERIDPDGKIDLLPGGWHDIEVRHAPMVGAYHIQFLYLGIQQDCWEGKNRYVLDADNYLRTDKN